MPTRRPTTVASVRMATFDTQECEQMPTLTRCRMRFTGTPSPPYADTLASATPNPGNKVAAGHTQILVQKLLPN